MALLAILAALAVGGPIGSEDAFKAFQSICAATAAEPRAAAARADELGWTRLPEESRQRMASGADNPETVETRSLEKDGNLVLILVADRTTRPIRGETLSINNCQVGMPGADYSTVLSLVKAWAAVPETTGPDPAKGRLFVFADDAGQHTALTDAEIDAATAADVRARRVTQVFVYNHSRGPTIRVGVPVQ